MSAFMFQSIRLTILVLWLAYATYLRFKHGTNVNLHVFLWLLALLMSWPSVKLLTFKSPLYLLCNQIGKKNRERCNVEIYRCLSQLKNMAISMTSKALSSDYIIREIAKCTKIIKPHINRLLGFWYEGRYIEGQEYFYSAIGTEFAKSFVGLLGKLDYISPDKLITQIELYQNQVSEQRKTEVKNRREGQGNLVFIIALVSGFIILLNFLVVVAGIDTYKMFSKVSF